jgi:hypothetical protein
MPVNEVDVTPRWSGEPPPTAAAAGDGATERRRVPAECRGPYFGAVREAWRLARAAGDDGRVRLSLALAVYARDGRARGVPVATLLRALDTIVAPHAGGDDALDYGGARAWAGSALIRAYYRDD